MAYGSGRNLTHAPERGSVTRSSFAAPYAREVCLGGLKSSDIAAAHKAALQKRSGRRVAPHSPFDHRSAFALRRFFVFRISLGISSLGIWVFFHACLHWVSAAKRCLISSSISALLLTVRETSWRKRS